MHFKKITLLKLRYVRYNCVPLLLTRSRQRIHRRAKIICYEVLCCRMRVNVDAAGERMDAAGEMRRHQV